jgi:tetratricopeptide (TPR) repeat protein
LILSQLGSNAFEQGQWQEAQTDLLQALPTLREAGLAFNVSQALYALGRWAEAAGQREAADQYLQESITLSEPLPDLLTLCQVRSIEAECQLLKGQPQQDHTLLEALVNQAINRGTDVTGHLPLLAWTQLARNKEERAQAEVIQAIARARTLQMRPALADALRVQALLRIQQQRWEEAQGALEEVLTLCQAMPSPYAEAKALYVYGLFYQAKGEPLQARERLEAALAILRRLGERLYAEQVERSLAGLEH